MRTLNLFRKLSLRRNSTPKDHLARLLRFKYSAFEMLTDSNTQLLRIITDIEEKLRGDQTFGMSYVRAQADRAMFHTLRMVKNLDDLSQQRYPALLEVYGSIEAELRKALGQKNEEGPVGLVCTLDHIAREMVDSVGAKIANLGEMHSRLGLPVPEGFAITAQGFSTFLSYNNLFEKIDAKKMEIDPRSVGSIAESSRQIQQMIMSAEIPPELNAAILESYRLMGERIGRNKTHFRDVLVALRSSASGEDREGSFAGQYLTLLNVTPEGLIPAYKEVVASLYSAPAIAYRLDKGIRDEDMAMSVACLEMIDAVASGVVYTSHPFNLLDDNILITAVWGLGPYAVEGRITPDSYRVDKDDVNHILNTTVSHKQVQLVARPDGGACEIPVEKDRQDVPCLTPSQMGALAGYALTLERHYKGPQDIEWALDRQGRLVLLQTRPLRVRSLDLHAGPIPSVSDRPLISGGTTAYPGVACGPAYRVNSEEDLVDFPEGAILVARSPSPKFATVMRRARAILTDLGSVAGHMASLAREFSVPTILDTRVATSTVSTGMEITVDAYSGRVYRGFIPELAALQKVAEPPMRGTPVYEALEKIAGLIVPLNLTDPKSSAFGPRSCKTLHDMGRLMHEVSYAELFQIGDLAAGNEGFAVRLDARIPLDLYVSDLGGGIVPQKEDARRIGIEDVASVPFKALLKGMTHDSFRRDSLRPVNLGGFVSVMMEQMTAPPPDGVGFGEGSFAIVSESYLNFSSRVGYHYGALDAYCAPGVDRNHIGFSFKGGAADYVRRNRRVRAIALILRELDFAVETHEDSVNARLQKSACDVITDRLDMLGRLIVYTRQMDMLMHSEESVQAVADDFLSGNYTLDRIRHQGELTRKPPG